MVSKKMLFAVLVFSLALTGAARAKNLTLLAISKGEVPEDNKGCEITISEENGEKQGDFTLLLKYEKKGWAAVSKPVKTAWGKYKTVHFNVFNPSDKPIDGIVFMVKGAKMTDAPDNRKDWPLTLKPGKNEVVLQLKNQICADGKSVLDVTRILRWSFYNMSDADGLAIYVQKIWLEE